MRPGKLLTRLLIVVAALSLLLAISPLFAWVVAVAFACVVFLAVSEAIALRRIRVTIERPEKIALALDEIETTSIRVRTSSMREVRMTIRQLWPRVVEQRSSIVHAVCRPGEVVALE